MACRLLDIQLLLQYIPLKHKSWGKSNCVNDMQNFHFGMQSREQEATIQTVIWHVYLETMQTESSSNICRGLNIFFTKLRRCHWPPYKKLGCKSSSYIRDLTVLKVLVSSYYDESGIILTMVMDYVRCCFLNHPIWKTEVFDMYVQNTHSFGHRAKKHSY